MSDDKDLVTKLQQAQAREAWYLAKLEEEAMPQCTEVNGRVIQKLWTKDEWSKAASEALAQKPTPQKPAGKKLRELLIRGRQACKEADWLARQLAAQSRHSVVYWRKLAHRAVEGE